MMTTNAEETAKAQAAKAALETLRGTDVIGVGTGSTVGYFIAALAEVKHQLDGAVASSEDTAKKLREAGIRVLDLNAVGTVAVYVDGADEATRHGALIKGGGGALTREKILAAASRQFVCIIHRAKLVDILGNFGLPVEIIPMARSYVARELVRRGAQDLLLPLLFEIVEAMSHHTVTPPGPDYRTAQLDSVVHIVPGACLAVKPRHRGI